MFSDDFRSIFGYSRGVLEVFGGVSDMFGGVLDVSGCFLTDSRDVRKIFLIFVDDFCNFMVLQLQLIWLDEEMQLILLKTVRLGVKC